MGSLFYFQCGFREKRGFWTTEDAKHKTAENARKSIYTGKKRSGSAAFLPADRSCVKIEHLSLCMLAIATKYYEKLFYFSLVIVCNFSDGCRFR
jgi:hypothetical protein